MNQVTTALSPEQVAKMGPRPNKPVTEEAVELSPPTFVSGKGGERELVVALEFPVEYDGKVYDEIRIRRPLMKEWVAYNRACEDAVKFKGPGADDLVDMPWISAPAIVLEHLDFVDGAKVEAAQAGFFGRSTLPPEDETDPQSPQE